jgi:replicative DNA helicase
MCKDIGPTAEAPDRMGSAVSIHAMQQKERVSAMGELIRLSDLLREELPDWDSECCMDAVPVDWAGSAPSTGFERLDALLGGMPSEGFSLIAGRPGTGKTSFLVDLAIIAAKQGVPVTFFSLELGRRNLVQRFLAAEACVGLHSLQRETPDKDLASIWQAAHELSGLQIYISDDPIVDARDIEFLADKALSMYGAERGDRKPLVLVDYLQLLEAGQATNAVSRFDSAARSLKTVSKRMGCPVIAACQVMRRVEQRSGKKPCLDDLRYPSIEKYADAVLLINRVASDDDREDLFMPRKGKAELIAAKNVWGPTGSTILGFDDWCSRFIEL